VLTAVTVATLRERWASFAGAFVALCLGAAVLAMTGLVLASGRAQPPARYAGAPVLVQSPAVGEGDGFFTENLPWSPETTRRLTRELGRVPGVRAAVPDRSFYVQLVIDGRPVAPDGAGARGHGWSSAALAPYRLVAGAPPVREGQVVLPRTAGPRPGQPVTRLTAAGPASYNVTGRADGPGGFVADAAA
jgi:putative ABC transport system permease protein